MSQREVEVSTHVDAVVAEAGVVAAVVVELLKEVALMCEVHSGEVFHVFRTTTDIHAGIV